MNNLQQAFYKHLQASVRRKYCENVPISDMIFSIDANVRIQREVQRRTILTTYKAMVEFQFQIYISFFILDRLGNS